MNIWFEFTLTDYDSYAEIILNEQTIFKRVFLLRKQISER